MKIKMFIGRSTAWDLYEQNLKKDEYRRIFNGEKKVDGIDCKFCGDKKGYCTVYWNRDFDLKRESYRTVLWCIAKSTSGRSSFVGKRGDMSKNTAYRVYEELESLKIIARRKEKIYLNPKVICSKYKNMIAKDDVNIFGDEIEFEPNKNQVLLLMYLYGFKEATGEMLKRIAGKVDTNIKTLKENDLIIERDGIYEIKNEEVVYNIVQDYVKGID